MTSRKTISHWAWLSVYEAYYGDVTGTPTSDGTGSCSFDFGVDTISNANWANLPTATGMAYSLLGMNSVVVTDHASWSDGTTRRIAAVSGRSIWAKKSGSNFVLQIT